MLQSLVIKNYAIIEQLQLNFNNDFTVITGETGAGKSILLGALSLILGQRADTSVLNDKEKKCVVEGTFNVSEKLVAPFFKNNDLDLDFPIIVRREISANGKSRAFINDTPVNLNTIKELSLTLIDIHSQHETLELNSSDFQIEVIDAFANTDELLKQYKQYFSEYQKLQQNYQQLLHIENEAKSDLDYLSFQLDELKVLKLQPGEQVDIENQLDIINNAEQILTTIQQSGDMLLNSDDSIISRMNTITQNFSKISHCSENYTQLLERLNTVLIELKDIAREIDVENDSIDVDASKLDYLTNRLNNIYALTQKHRVANSDELIELENKLENQLNDINSAEEKLKHLKQAIEKSKAALLIVAEKLSAKRKSIFKALEKNIIDNLKGLGMGDASFKIEHLINNDFSSTGIDQIDFMFSANKGMPLKPLHKTASGGELSRLMLTIKAILAKNSSIQTIVFDEIDTGVSGDIAYKMAAIMGLMSEKIQIIAITHLPQVAAKGDTHFKIYKENHQNKTLTKMKVLVGDDRIDEIAKMLSGKELTGAAKENARHLLTVK
ncbi:MAG: DNA repair protein RecN [Flavobacteriales bacterium]|nr:DNA repair protein RecN [Flavobacteriales bacterium]MCW8911779.1 DNA repair protein RecN [Flavobacteriales bacterium]MCW8937837.1 DNA repair protein RecN [Flavobacteriales bacterium]MCW8939924.1 DNA repair protein RecN [Flavobacteriales bacterium]MCW8967684.1 DNA repair protein RecN [Flavobacteriales bacterium]